MASRNELELKAVEQKLGEKADQIEAIWKKAKDDDRDSTPEELEEVGQLLKDMETLKGKKKDIDAALEVEAEVKKVSRDLGRAEPMVTRDREDRIIDQLETKTLGEIFVESDGFKKIQDSMGRAGQWTSGPFEVKGGISDLYQTKGTITEAVGSGAGLAAPVPQVIPGVVQKLFQRLTFADLIESGQASTNAVRYVVEGTATSGAAGVGEAGSKPESLLGLSTTDEPIKKIATFLPISDEMLEDAPAVQSYINARLGLFVRIEEERQLLRGTASGNEIQGMLTSRSIPVYAGGTAAGNKAVQMFKAMNGLRGSAFVEPEWIVIHPTDYQDIRLLTDTAGQFFGGGPFQGPYGNGSNVDANNQNTGAQDRLWNTPVYVTAAIGGAGTALIGTRAGAQVWRRGGLNVEASNSHSTYFQLNLVAIRAEERLGLAVYRPGAYVEARLS
jgi:HK97 family phage major capsid protein